MMSLAIVKAENSKGFLLEVLNSKDKKVVYIIENRKHEKIEKFDNEVDAMNFLNKM